MSLARTGGIGIGASQADLRLTASIDLSGVIRDLEGLTRRRFTVDVETNTQRMMEQMTRTMRPMNVEVRANEQSRRRFGEAIGDAVTSGITLGLVNVRAGIASFFFDIARDAFGGQQVIQESVARLTEASGGSRAAGERVQLRLQQSASRAGLNFQENAAAISSLFNVLRPTVGSNEEVFERIDSTLLAVRALAGARGAGAASGLIQAFERPITSGRVGRQELAPLLLRGATQEEIAEAAGLSLEGLQQNLARGALFSGIMSSETGEIAARLSFNNLTEGGTVANEVEFIDRLVEVLARRARNIQDTVVTSQNRFNNASNQLITNLDNLTGATTIWRESLSGLTSVIEGLSSALMLISNITGGGRGVVEGASNAVGVIATAFNPFVNAVGEPNALGRAFDLINQFFAGQESMRLPEQRATMMTPLTPEQLREQEAERAEMRRLMQALAREEDLGVGDFATNVESATESLRSFSDMLTRATGVTLGSGGNLLTRVDTLGNVISSESQVN